MAQLKMQPISALAFARTVARSRPPPGWSDTLVIANSGGADSTCLMFLLNRHLRELPEGASPDDLPKRLVSLSIDHDLQSSSAKMSELAGTNARSLGIEHITAKLPWGKPRMAQKPKPTDKIEEVARRMRFLMFFEHLQTLGANAIAMGHHADDQVETMLMRLGRGASRHGLGAMRPLRRWGMGDRTEKYGLEGMRKWVVRPLLSFSKDQLRATCEVNKLNYVEDQTNFQPQLTIRNAIRDQICHNSLGDKSYKPTLPEDIALQLQEIQNFAVKTKTGFDLNSSPDDLRRQNQGITHDRDQGDTIVDEIIESCRIPSPPGTFLMLCRDFDKIPDGPLNAEEGLLYRITRYVSPASWGHPQAELGRRKHKIDSLMEHLSNWSRRVKQSNPSLCPGSHVWWRLVVSRNGRMNFMVKDAAPQNLAWLATRQPPIARHKGVDPRVELSFDDLKKRVRTGLMGEQAEYLFDSRFAIQFQVDKMPKDLADSLAAGGKLLVVASKPWFHPEVYYQEKLLHSYIETPHEWRKAVKYMKGVRNSGWITIDFCRSISAL